MHKALMLTALALNFSRVLAPEQRPVWQQRLRWPQQYETSWYAREPASSGLGFYSLGGALQLIRVGTFEDPQRPRQLFYVYDQNIGTGSLLTLAWLSRTKGKGMQAQQAQEITGLSEFEPRQQVLSVLLPGPCGHLIRWRFIQARPMLKEVRSQACPDPAGSSAPANWPRSWP